MPLLRKYQNQKFKHSEIVIQTTRQLWVIPKSAVIMKTLFQEQQIRSNDLTFACHSDCQIFIKNLLLLALEDEYKNQHNQHEQSFDDLMASLFVLVTHYSLNKCDSHFE